MCRTQYYIFKLLKIKTKKKNNYYYYFKLRTNGAHIYTYIDIFFSSLLLLLLQRLIERRQRAHCADKFIYIISLLKRERERVNWCHTVNYVSQGAIRAHKYQLDLESTHTHTQKHFILYNRLWITGPATNTHTRMHTYSHWCFVYIYKCSRVPWSLPPGRRVLMQFPQHPHTHTFVLLTCAYITGHSRLC